MNKKIRTMLIAASVLLIIAGIIFLCVAIIGKESSKGMLGAALGCIVLANLFNVVQRNLNFADDNEA